MHSDGRKLMGVLFVKIKSMFQRNTYTHTRFRFTDFTFSCQLSRSFQIVAYKHEEIAFAWRKRDLAEFDRSPIFKFTSRIINILCHRFIYTLSTLHRKYRFFSSPEFPRARKRPCFSEATLPSLFRFIIILISIALSNHLSVLSQYLLLVAHVDFLPFEGRSLEVRLRRVSTLQLPPTHCISAIRAPVRRRRPEAARRNDAPIRSKRSTIASSRALDERVRSLPSRAIAPLFPAPFFSCFCFSSSRTRRGKERRALEFGRGRERETHHTHVRTK